MPSHKSRIAYNKESAGSMTATLSIRNTNENAQETEKKEQSH